MSNPTVFGVHHISLCARGAQEDIDFFTKVLGQRMIKQTVLFDGRYALYHLYYANANAEPGSVLTTFVYGRADGRPGSGQISATTYTVSKGTLPFWLDHLTRHDVEHSELQERFGQRFVRFKHPSGLLLEVIEDPDDPRQGWTTSQIDSEVATHGFYGPLLSVREVDEQERFLTEALGFRRTGTDGAYHRFEIGAGGANRTVTLVCEPDRKMGSWGFGAGTGHHMALDLGNDDALAEQKNLYEELGFTDCSEIKDRNYFHSIYVRSPGGILTECAATAEGGFARDEAWEDLGQSLLLPPWFEHKRDEITRMLEPIIVPEENNPGGLRARSSSTPAPAASQQQPASDKPGAAGPSRRTNAKFIDEDGSQEAR